MGLTERKACFDEIAQRFTHTKPTDLVAVHQMKPELFANLQMAAAVYMSKVLFLDEVILSEERLLELFIERKDDIKNITPNGIIVPKRHFILEYNLFLKAFIDIVYSLGIVDLVASWHVPINLRIKYGLADEANMNRSHPSEHVHSDSWAGESKDGATSFVPIFGDIERNHMTIFEPPEEFEEDWLSYKETYKEGEVIAQKYSKVDFVPEKGQIILADFATLHASTRLEGAGPRVSIDTTFLPKHRQDQVASELPSHGRAPLETLRGVGEERMFVFPHSLEEMVDSQGGKRHPSQYEILELWSEEGKGYESEVGHSVHQAR